MAESLNSLSEPHDHTYDDVIEMVRAGDFEVLKSRLSGDITPLNAARDWSGDGNLKSLELSFVHLIYLLT